MSALNTGIGTASESTNYTTQVFDSKQYNAATGATAIEGSGSNTSLSLSGSTIAGALTLNQESPQAISALENTARNAMMTAGASARAAGDVAKAIAEKSLDIAGSATRPAGETIRILLMGVAVVAVIGYGIYKYGGK